MCDRLNLTADERERVRRNTHVEWVNDVTGSNFFSALDDFLVEFPADLLIINPYTAYQGGDIRDDKLNNQFLRVHLARIMNATIAARFPFITPQRPISRIPTTIPGLIGCTQWPADRPDQLGSRSPGCCPLEMPGAYKFVAAKRYEKIGWRIGEYWFAHPLDDGRSFGCPLPPTRLPAAAKARMRSRPICSP